MSARILFPSLTVVFLNANLSHAQECAYAPTFDGSHSLVAQDETPILGHGILVLGRHDPDFLAQLAANIQVDCAILPDQSDAFETAYSFMLPQIESMMEGETLSVQPNPSLPNGKMTAIAQCGVINVNYNPEFFENRDREFTKALINLMGIISSGDYRNGSHRGEYEYHAEDGANVFSLEEYLCIS